MDFYLLLGTHATKVAKNLNNKYGQKLIDTAKKPATDQFKKQSKQVGSRNKWIVLGRFRSKFPNF